MSTPVPQRIESALIESDPRASSELANLVMDAYYSTTAARSHVSRTEYYTRSAQNLERSLGSWLPADQDAKCLDLGCGCGEFLYLLEQRGMQNVFGVDACEEELAQARFQVRSPLNRADVLDYLVTSPSESFDFVTALNLLEHLPKDKLLRVLRECRRVLRPGGSLIAMVPNATSPFSSVTRHWDITHEWAFTTNNFQQLAALVGFDQDVRFRECGPRIHGFISGCRFLLWQILRAGIAAWFLIEVGNRRSSVYTMDMLVRLRVPK